MNISGSDRSKLPIWYVPTKTIPPGFARPPAAQDGYAGPTPEPLATRPFFPEPVRPAPAPVWSHPTEDLSAATPRQSETTWSAPEPEPSPTREPAPQPVDNSALLRSLESIKSTAGDAGYQAGQLSDSLGYSQSTQPKTDAESAAWTLRNAETDTETTDSSSYGKDAQYKLDSISSALGYLASGSSQVGSLSSAISSIRSQLASIDRSRLSDPSRLDRISSSLSTLESNLSGAQSSTSNIEGSAAEARYSLSQGVYYVAQVSADGEGVNVSSAASSGRGYVETLAGHLDNVRSNATSGGHHLRSMQNGFGDIADDADALTWQIRA